MCSGLLPLISYKTPGKDLFLAMRLAAFTPFLCIAIAFCVIMGSIVVVMITILTERVITNIGEKGGNKTGEVKLSLASSEIQWKRCYHLIDGLVCEISRSFGFILLVLVTFNFIWMITTSYTVVANLKELGDLTNTAYNHLIMLTMSASFLCVTIFILHQMKIKVRSNYDTFFLN